VAGRTVFFTVTKLAIAAIGGNTGNVQFIAACAAPAAALIIFVKHIAAGIIRFACHPRLVAYPFTTPGTGCTPLVACIHTITLIINLITVEGGWAGIVGVRTVPAAVTGGAVKPVTGTGSTRGIKTAVILFITVVTLGFRTGVTGMGTGPPRTAFGAVTEKPLVTLGSRVTV
jgi:hypothetical protein